LALQTVKAMLSMGILEHTAWSYYTDTLIPVIKVHCERGKECFDRDVVTGCAHELEARFDNGEITLNTYQKYLLGLQRITEVYDTGKLVWSAPRKTSRFLLNDYYEEILTQAIAQEDVSPKAKSDMTWVGKKYFSWLIQEGYPELSRVGAEEVQRFMIFCSEHMASTSVYDVKLYMKKLYRYLAEKGYSASTYRELLSFPVSRESRMFPALSQEEIALILEMVNRRTPKGKRDYAILLLGVVTGLRAGDISKLRLSDIDWRNGEIKIVQSKTRKSLALPLTKDVGEAIQDYILHGRQQTLTDTLFLRIHAPFQGFSNGVAIEDMYDSYRRKAGLPRDANDGKGFHALRRSLGKNLVTSGAPITMVAQVLGDSNIDSTKKYISLDSEHLKECALDFTGIELETGCFL